MNYLAIFKGDSDEEEIVDQDYMYYDSETGCYTGINRGQTSRAKLPSKNNLRYLDLSGVGRAGDQGAKYLGFFSSRSLKTREKCISFAQLVLLSLYIF